jgi:hypothetical protein
MKRLHAGADSEKAEADAMKVMPGDKASRDAKRAAMTKARATERAARGDAEVKKKTLPRPRSGIQPKVSAIYRPTRARKSPGGGAP